MFSAAGREVRRYAEGEGRQARPVDSIQSVELRRWPEQSAGAVADSCRIAHPPESASSH